MNSKKLSKENKVLRKEVDRLKHALERERARSAKLLEIVSKQCFQNFNKVMVNELKKVRAARLSRARVLKELIQTEQGFQKHIRTVIVHYLKPLKNICEGELLGLMDIKDQSVDQVLNKYVARCSKN